MRPVLFELPFDVPIYSYGLMLCLSVLIGRVIALHLAEREGMQPAQMNRCTVWIMAGALIGSRLLYVVTTPREFHSILEVVEFWKGGVVAYGGFLGGFVAAVVFCRRHRIALLPWADCVVPTLALGLVLTRIGCFLGGCDFGVPSDGALAVSFPAGSPAHDQQVAEGLIPAAALQSLPVHPTQLYEAFAGLVLLVAVLAARRARRHAGEPFILFVVGYAVLRAGIETLRGDFDRGGIGALSTSQLIAAASFVTAAAFIYLMRRHPSRFGGSPAGLTV